MLKNLIQIKPLSSHHGLFLMVLSLVAFIFLLMLSHWLWPTWRLPFIGGYLVCIILFMIGALKKLQPKHSLEIRKTSLKYIQLSGHWDILWQDIHIISDIKITLGTEQVLIPYIGIKLKAFEQLIDLVPIRLANKLIHEQKTLLIWAVNHHLISYEQSIINFSPYKTVNKCVITGPLAAFMHHSQLLSQIFGYHLYIPSSALDRDISAFVLLLKDCQRHVNHHTDIY